MVIRITFYHSRLSMGPQMLPMVYLLSTRVSIICWVHYANSSRKERTLCHFSLAEVTLTLIQSIPLYEKMNMKR